MEKYRLSSRQLASGLPYTYDVPYQHQAEFKAAEREAREHQRGFWAPNTCSGDTTQPADSEHDHKPASEPQPTEQPAQEPPSRGGDGDPNYSGACIPAYPHLATTYLTHTCRQGGTKTYRLGVDAMSLRTANSCQYAELWPNAHSRPSRPQCVFVPLS